MNSESQATPAELYASGAPLSVEHMRRLQADAQRDFQIALDQVVDMLAQESPIKSTASVGGTLAGAVLARASRRIGNDTKERRELAKMLLLGALLNHDNPDWNPADASTDRADHDDPFIALLQMDLRAQT
ncbi:MAG: hypothetical protein ACXWIN_06850 [Burkholderiaceae bacterium]